MPKDDATPTGVSKREEDMEALIKQREGERESLEPEPKPEPELKPEPEPEPKPKPEVFEFEDADGNLYQVPRSAKAKLKIDGEEIVTPLDQMTRRYQKGAAGDRRLQEANNIKKALEEKEQALTRREQELLDKLESAKQKNDDGNLSDDDYQKQVKELVDAVIEADEEKAVELFSKVYKPQPPQAIDESVIEERANKAVEKKLKEKEQNDYQTSVTEANEKFFSQYSDLAGDEMLLNMVDRETAKINQERPGADPWEIISEAAETVKEWRDKLAKPAPKKKTTPTPASGRARIGEDPKPAPTRKDVLNDMRASRGQPPL